MAAIRIDGNRLFFESQEGKTIVSLDEEIMGKRTMIVSINGELNSEVVSEFEDEMISLSIYFNQIILECEGTTYISNSAISFLLQLQHIMENKEGILVIKDLSDSVMKAFCNMGLEDMFDIR